MNKIFVVNLDKATDRWKHYEGDDRFTDAPMTPMLGETDSATCSTNPTPV